MATSWKSQQGDGKYALQFETDDKEKYKFVEKASQMAVDGKHTADVVEVVRCKNCTFWDRRSGYITGRCESHRNGLIYENTDEDDYCSYGERKEKE